MTDTPEPALLPRQGAWHVILTYAAPALVMLAIVVPFLRFHEYSLILPESLILMAGAAWLGAIVGGLMRIRPQTLGPILMAATLFGYLFYRQEITDALVKAANAIADNVVGTAPLMLAILAVAMFLALCPICVLLRRHLDKVVVAVFGTIVLTTVVLPTDTGGEPVAQGALPSKRNDLPPLIHIILDEHIGLAGLPAEIAKSDAIRETVPRIFKDFRIYSHAYSRFAETKFSLTSLMNRDLGANVAALVEGEDVKFAPKKNDWFDALDAKGYAIKVYQSAWFDMCGGSRAVDACYTYSFFSPNALQRTPLSTVQRLRALTSKLLIGDGALQMEPLVSMEALARFRSDVAQSSRGVAYIVHLLIPHFGYLYGADCTLLDPAHWERDRFGEDRVYSPEERDGLYRRYLPQMACADREMDLLFAELKTLGIYDEATIIVHGDHGSRIGERPYITEMPQSLTTQDMIDHYSTFVAIKAPGTAPGIDDRPEALQRIFADAFLGGSLPTSPGPGKIFVRRDEENNFGPLDFAWPEASPTPIAERSDAAPVDDAGASLLTQLRR